LLGIRKIKSSFNESLITLDRIERDSHGVILEALQAEFKEARRHNGGVCLFSPVQFVRY
jgi:hypothetical protein